MDMPQLKPFTEFKANYQILEELGRGASAICYRVVHLATQQSFAMKKIEYRLIQHSKAGIARQISLLQTIDHPNIIKFIQAYQDNSSVYIIMEYNRDKDLSQIIKARKKEGREFTYPQIWKIFRQILAGLIYIHGKRIIHRDIKPSNIFLNQNLDVKIGDLGAAKLVKPTEENYTRIGTPYYLPPEIIKYDRYSFKADVWSLGVTIYYLTILELPFQASNIIRLGQVIVYQQPLYPTILPPLLCRAIQDMLQKKEENRPSAQQLLDRYCSSQTAEDINELSQSSISQVVEDVFEDSFAINSSIDVLYLQTQRLPFENKGVKPSRRETMHLQEHKKQFENTSEAALNLTSMRHLHDDKTHLAEQIAPKLDEGDQTIVLTVNPNDCDNFVGYYKETQRSSLMLYNSTETNQKTGMKIGRKSSIFKQDLRNGTNTRGSLFLQNKENQKPAKYSSSHFTGQTRQESIIVSKRKHNQLMLNLKPLKFQQDSCPKQIKQKMTQLPRPELLVIENECELDI